MPRRFIASFAPHQFFRATFFRLSTVATLFAFFAMTGLVAYPTPALAACTNPAGAEGEMIYNDDFNVAQFCNGTSWVSMSGGASAGAESDPQVGATTLNKWCRGDGASVVCDLDAPLTTESDPKVGTLTGGKWCTTNGTVVECASDLPIGTLTSGKFCTTNGTTISCTTDAPTATAGADTQVIFNSGGTLTGDASFVWDNINKRLGIGTTGPTAPLDISTASTNSTYMHLTNTASSGRTWTLYSSGGGPAASGTFGIYDTTANSSRLSIDASGNVGIGTTTPGSRLYVEGSDAAYSASIVNTRGDASGNGLYVQTRWNVPTNYLARFTTNSGTQEVLAIKGDGNVGIGTASPGAKLDIQTATGPSTEAARVISGSTAAVWIAPHVGAGSWNGISQSGDQGIYFQGASGVGTGNLVIAPWAAATSGIRITSAGNVGIGAVSPGAKLDVRGQIIGGFGSNSTGGTLDWNDATNARSGSGASLLYASATNGPGGGAYYYHPFSFEYNSKDGTGNMTQLAISYGDSATSINNGAMFLRGRYSGVWTGWYKFTTAAVSDYRAKKDVRPLEGALAKVMQMRPVKFNYKEGKGPAGEQEGFIAHELQRIAPYSVTGKKDAVDAAGNPLLQNIDLARLTPLLAGALQELNAANDNLKAENAALRDAFDELRGRIEKLEYGK